MTKTAEQVVAEAFTRVREPEYHISEEEDSSDARIAVAALRDAGMLAETEWEYDVVRRPEDCTAISSLAYPTLEKAKNWRQHLRNMGQGDRLIMRRRPAGPWLPVEGESK